MSANNAGEAQKLNTLPVAMAKSIVMKPLDDLSPYENNARVHTPEQVNKIAESIREFGFTNPILIDPDGSIIAGHGRLLAAKEIGMEDVPTIVLPGLTDTQKRALRLAEQQGLPTEPRQRRLAQYRQGRPLRDPSGGLRDTSNDG